MNLAEPFIRRPVMTTLVMSGILLFGLLAYRSLPVNDLPNVDYPTVQVQASLPGASPETMASSVATPLERQFSTITGLDSMTSMNTLGGTQIVLQFNLRRNIDAAAQDVQSMIAKAQGQLPPDMPTPPSYQKVNPADQPILYMAVYSEELPLSTVTEYADTLMAQRISMTSGVAQVQVYGMQKYAVRVQLDPKALATRQIGIDEVADAIRQANVNLPTGTLFGTHKAFTVMATGQSPRWLRTQCRVVRPRWPSLWRRARWARASTARTQARTPARARPTTRSTIRSRSVCSPTGSASSATSRLARASAKTRRWNRRAMARSARSAQV